MVIHIVPEGSDPVEHLVPQGKHLLVHTGDNVIAGSQLTEGPRDPNNILDINGEEALYNYMISEVQNVYRAQGVPVSDKHIEVILSRMLSKIQVQKAGDTKMLPMEFVERYKFRFANSELDGCLLIKESGDTGFAVGDLVKKDEIKEANAIAEAEGKTPAKTSRPEKKQPESHCFLELQKPPFNLNRFCLGRRSKKPRRSLPRQLSEVLKIN